MTKEEFINLYYVKAGDRFTTGYNEYKIDVIFLEYYDFNNGKFKMNEFFNIEEMKEFLKNKRDYLKRDWYVGFRVSGTYFTNQMIDKVYTKIENQIIL